MQALYAGIGKGIPLRHGRRKTPVRPVAPCLSGGPLQQKELHRHQSRHRRSRSQDRTTPRHRGKGLQRADRRILQLCRIVPSVEIIFYE